MYLATPTPAAPAAPLPPPGARPVRGVTGTTNGVLWAAYEDQHTFLYGFTTSAGFTGDATYETATRAEKEAKRWCAAYVAELVFEDAAPLEVVSAEAFMTEVEHLAVKWDQDTGPVDAVVSDDEPLSVTVAGWDVLATAGRPGTFKAELANASTGQRGATDKDFTGFPTPAAALKAGVAWATEHPCDPRLAALDEPHISAKVAGQVVDPEEVYGDADEPLGDEVPGTGWHVTTVDGKAGTFDGLLLSEDGEVCPERFSGHTTRGGAAAEAREWARANPTGSALAGRFIHDDGEEPDGGGGLPGPDELQQELNAAVEPNAAPAVDTLALGDSAEVVLLRAEVDLLREQLAAANAGIAADVGGLLVKAERHDELLRRQAALTFQAQGIKDELKGVVQELASLGVEGFGMIKALGTGTRAKTWQLGLTFDKSSAVRASVGAQVEGFGRAYEVNPASGLPSLSYPLEVPPGRAGHAPQLALHYHAGSGAGILGLGWSLDLPAIERSTRAGIPRADISPIWQLRHLSDGEELTETAPGVYRQRIEQGPPIVVRMLPGGGMSALATDGTGYLFGLTEDARITGDAGLVRLDLSAITDVHGNRIDFAYTREAGSDAPLLSTITWNEGNARVALRYEARPDILVSHATGQRLALAHRLHEIRTEVAGERVRTTTLTYARSIEAPSSRLVAIAAVAADGAALPTWRLTYTGETATPMAHDVAGAPALNPTAEGQAVAAIGTQKWAFLGTEHVIESSNQDTPQGMRYTTWLKGHRETTEGFGETYEQAAEQTKAAASVVFADCDPGQTTPSVDPAVPPKRGRKPKLGGHDMTAVKAAIESSPTVVAAAMELGVTPQKLEAFCAKNDLALPGGEPQPPAKRGRKPKAVAT